jgi:hypothetical protein
MHSGAASWRWLTGESVELDAIAAFKVVQGGSLESERRVGNLQPVAGEIGRQRPRR